MLYIKRSKGFSLVGMLLATAIAALLCCAAVKVYFKGPSVDKETQESLAKEGINPANYPESVEIAQKTAENFNKLAEERAKEYQKQLE